MWPSMLIGSLAEPNCGAYASSRPASALADRPPVIAVAMTSIRLSTPARPTPWAPRMRSVSGSTSSLSAIVAAPG